MTIYGQMNLLLVISLFLFTLLRRVSFSYRQMIHLAQAFILASLLLPVAFHFTPPSYLPELSFEEFVPSREDALFFLDKKETQTLLPQKTNSLETTTESWEREDLFILLLVIGFFISFSRFLINIKKLKRLLNRSISFRRYGTVHIVLSDEVTIPFSVKLGIKKWVAIPLAMIEHDRDFKMAILHELQHHRQGDSSWAVISEFLTTLFFMNPAFYLLKKEIVQLQEYSCDEALIERGDIAPHDYGLCLMRVAQEALKKREVYLSTTLMASPKESFLRKRVMLLREEKKKSSSFKLFFSTLCGIGAIVVLFVTASLFSPKLFSNSSPNLGVVTVATPFQEMAEKILEEGLKKAQAKKGFALVANPQTGVILAIANIDTEKKLTGYWSLALTFSPASTLKTLLAAQAIESRVTDVQSLHNVEQGKYLYHGKLYKEWKERGWNFLSTEDILAYSSEIGAMKLAEKLEEGEAGSLRRLLPHFGFGPGGTASSFPQSRSGLLPQVAEGPEGDHQLVSYLAQGSSFLISPIEMLQAYGAIANGGKLLMPQVAEQSPQLQKSQMIRKVLTLENAEKMKKMLQRVVLKGTARGWGESALYTTAGKTGSLNHSSMGKMATFIGFAPVENPQLEIYVAVIDPKEDANGASQAAPIFKQLIEKFLPYSK